MDSICKKIKSRYKFKYDLNAILSDLIYPRILEPSSKRSSYQAALKFLEAPSYELHDVYRTLSILAKELDFIQSEVYKNSFFFAKQNDKILYYNCTNYYFEIEQEDSDKSTFPYMFPGSAPFWSVKTTIENTLYYRAATPGIERNPGKK